MLIATPARRNDTFLHFKIRRGGIIVSRRPRGKRGKRRKNDAEAIHGVLALAAFASVADAQESPVADVAVGYSFIQIAGGSGLSANGGGGSVAVSVNNWLGVA